MPPRLTNEFTLAAFANLSETMDQVAESDTFSETAELPWCVIRITYNHMIQYHAGAIALA